MHSLKIKDYTVSGEEFYLVKNHVYGFLETTPKPKEEKLSNYYKSNNYISHTNTKRNSFEVLYHGVRKIALNQKINLINGFKTESKNLLDFGCGTGHFLKTAQTKGWKVVGIEPNAQARTIANQLTNNKVLNANQVLNFKIQTFDVITLWHVLEHLPNLENDILNIKKLLKPNGVLVVAVPNYKSFDAKYYKNFWAAFDVPRHLWHFDKNAIYKLFEKINLKVVKIKPMYFDAFYVSILSEKYKKHTFYFLRGFLIGCISNFKYFFTKEASSHIYILKNQ